jgi:hypothetical protein
MTLLGEIEIHASGFPRDGLVRLPYNSKLKLFLLLCLVRGDTDRQLRPGPISVRDSRLNRRHLRVIFDSMHNPS